MQRSAVRTQPDGPSADYVNRSVEWPFVFCGQPRNRKRLIDFCPGASFHGRAELLHGTFV